MQYLRQATGFFKGAAVGKALRDAAWSSAEQRLGKVQRAYAEVTGTAEVQQLEAKVARQYSALKQAETDFAAARAHVEEARAAFETKKLHSLKEIQGYELDSNLDAAMRSSFITQCQRELMSSKEAQAFQQSQEAAKTTEQLLKDGTSAYVEALSLKHTVETKWNNARSVLVTVGSIISVVGGLFLTPVVTMVTTSYRINSSVETSLTRSEEVMKADLKELLQGQREDLAELIALKGSVSQAVRKEPAVEAAHESGESAQNTEEVAQDTHDLTSAPQLTTKDALDCSEIMAAERAVVLAAGAVTVSLSVLALLAELLS